MRAYRYKHTYTYNISGGFKQNTPEQLEAGWIPPKPVHTGQELVDSAVVALGIAGHDSHGGNHLGASEAVVQVLPGLQVPDHDLKHAAPTVGQHGGWQAFACRLTGQTQAVTSACRRALHIQAHTWVRVLRGLSAHLRSSVHACAL